MKKVMFFRCMGCGKVAAPWEIKKHGSCPQCAGGKFRPTNLSFWEKLVQIIKRPAVWKWGAE